MAIIINDHVAMGDGYIIRTWLQVQYHLAFILFGMVPMKQWRSQANIDGGEGGEGEGGEGKGGEGEGGEGEGGEGG